jgi:hypothetical protein
MGYMFTLDGPENILSFLSGPIKAVRAAMEHGVSWADAVLEGQPRDSYMWAHLVRYAARNELGDGTDAWLVRRLANSGIEVVTTPLVMRTMKAQDGGPPSPGHSFARRAYWMQQGSLGLDWGGIQEPRSGANLILDWSSGLDHAVQLCLSKPVSTWKYKGQPKLAWSLPVEFGMDDVPHFAPSEESVDVEPKFDLDEFKSGSDE